MTLSQAINIGTEILTTADIENPEYNARYLLTAILNKNLLYPISSPNQKLNPRKFKEFLDLIKLRADQYPPQYLLGKQWFRDLQIQVGPGCFIPRPETELLVEKVIDEFSTEENGAIIEICTGSGAISIDLANNLPQMKILGIDISLSALTWAEKNKTELANYTNLNFINADLLNCINPHQTIRAIIVNPPYLATPQIEYLSPEIRDHEPHLALDGGKTGLEIIEKIILQSAVILPEKSCLFMELGQDQHQTVQKLLLQQGFNDIVFYKDYGQYYRIVKARKNENI